MGPMVRGNSVEGVLLRKALMQPYLVRSHWGDMLTVLSPTERERFASDVLKVVAQQGIPLEADAPCLWRKQRGSRRLFDWLRRERPRVARGSQGAQGARGIHHFPNEKGAKELPGRYPNPLC